MYIRMDDVRTDGRDVKIAPVFYRTLSPLGPLPKKAVKLREDILGPQRITWGLREVTWGLREVI